MSLAVFITAVLTAVVGIVLCLAGMAMMAANQKRGWGLDPIAWVGTGVALFGVLLLIIAAGAFSAGG